MKKYIIIFLAVCVSLGVFAGGTIMAVQQSKTAASQQKPKQQQQKPKQQQKAAQPAKQQQKPKQQQTAQPAKQQQKPKQQQKAAQPAKQQQKSAAAPQQSVNSGSKSALRNEKADVQRAKAESQAKANRLSQSIKTNMDSVIVLNNRIGRQQYSIDSLNRNINYLNVRIDSTSKQLDKLTEDLNKKMKNYGKAMTFLQRNMSIQEKIMFIFASDNLTQMFRRIRYISEYSNFQRAQGQLIREEQSAVREAQNKLLDAKNNLVASKSLLQKKQLDLQYTKQNCEEQVAYLNQNLAAVKDEIEKYNRREAAIDAQINRIIQAELEAARR